MNKFILALLVLVSAFNVNAQDGYPKPTNQEGMLFFIQHNRGKNTYIYALNYSDNKKLDEDSPIQVYRQIFDKSGEIKPLTAIQKNFAYGIETEQLKSNYYEASIVSLPTQKFFLTIPLNGKPFVETIVNGIKIKVNRIFIRQKDGTSGLSTKVDYILFYGTNKNKDVVLRLEIN